MNWIQPGPGAIPAGGRAFLALGLVCAIAFSAPAFAQGSDEEEDEAAELEVGRWYPSLEAGLLLNQSSFSSNWAGGDRGQFAWTALVNGDLRRRMSETIFWRNYLRLAYGKASKEDEDGNYDKPQKSTDRIDFESLLRGTFGYVVDPYFSLRVESQFEDVSDPFGRSSINFNPIFIKESAGVSHDFLSEESRQLLVRAGFAVRQALRRQYVSEDPTETELEMQSGTDGGLEFVVDYTDVYFEEDLSWTTKLTLYQPVFYSSKDELENVDWANTVTPDGMTFASDTADFTTALDVDWENYLTAQITKYVSATFYLRIVYDKYDTSVEPLFDEDGTLINPGAVHAAIRKAGQFKQTLALGLTYRFF